MTWINCKLSEFCDIVMGQSPPSTSYNTSGDGLPFFQGKAEFGELYPQIQKYCNKPKKIAERNDTLLSVRAPVGPTNIAIQKSCIGRGLAAIRALNSVNYKYVFYLLRSKQIYLSGQGTGTTFRAITKDFLYDLDIAISPLPEQAQVISVIEQLFSDLDNAIDNLKKAKDQLKVYRQSVLKYAFEGKLTEEWRKQNKLSNTDWRDMSVDDIGEVITGTTPSKKEPKYYGNEYPFYKPGDLDAGYFTNSSVDNLSEAGVKKARLLPAECILVTCIGATIGKTGLIRKAGACNQQINAIIPNKNVVNEHVYYFAISPWFQEQIKRTASATTLPILNKTKFQRLMIKVPSFDEQLQIVKEIERRFSICQQLDNTIDEQLQRSEALRQSILKQAFEGKLTSKWRKEHPELISGENSAKVLVEKIKAERETLANTRKRKK